MFNVYLFNNIQYTFDYSPYNFNIHKEPFDFGTFYGSFIQV